MVAMLDSYVLTCCAVQSVRMRDARQPRGSALANILRIKLPLYVTVNVIFKVSSPIFNSLIASTN